MTIQKQEPDRNTPKEKIHPVILKLAKKVLKDYLVNLPEGTVICHESIEMVLKMENIYLNWWYIAEIILPMVAGKNKVREFRFWFKKSKEEGKTDCLVIFTATTVDQSKTPQGDEGERNE
jgi:hypothetical protein